MKKVILAPYVSCGLRSNGDLSFGFGSLQRIITDPEKIRHILNAASFLKTPRDLFEIENFKKTNSENYGINFILDQPGLIKYVEPSNHTDRYHCSHYILDE